MSQETYIANALILETELHPAEAGHLHIKIKCHCAGFEPVLFLDIPPDEIREFGNVLQRCGQAGAIAGIIKAVDVTSWEHLPGKYVRIKHTGLGGEVLEIGNIIKETWCTLDNFK